MLLQSFYPQRRRRRLHIPPVTCSLQGRAAALHLPLTFPLEELVLASPAITHTGNTLQPSSLSVNTQFPRCPCFKEVFLRLPLPSSYLEACRDFSLSEYLSVLSLTQIASFPGNTEQMVQPSCQTFTKEGASRSGEEAIKDTWRLQASQLISQCVSRSHL